MFAAVGRASDFHTLHARNLAHLLDTSRNTIREKKQVISRRRGRHDASTQPHNLIHYRISATESSRGHYHSAELHSRAAAPKLSEDLWHLKAIGNVAIKGFALRDLIILFSHNEETRWYRRRIEKMALAPYYTERELTMNWQRNVTHCRQYWNDFIYRNINS